LFTAIITTVLPPALRTQVASNSFIVSEWFSSIAFILIGYEINLAGVKRDMNIPWRLIFCYLIGQLLDILTTFGFSYAMFTAVK
jgi:hypothetical protein